MTRTRRVVPRTEPAAIPPVVCGWCGGARVEPDEECGSIPCLECDGSGYRIVTGDLGATHACRKGRPFRFVPRLNRLTVRRGKLLEEYALAEFAPDPLPGGPSARAWECVKARTGEVHHLLALAGGGISCDCAGRSYEGTARANWRAFLEEREQAASLGCIHADFLALALSAGLMDAE